MKYVKICRLLSIALVLVFSLLVPSMPVFAQAPTIAISPSTGVVGTQIAVTITGFTSGNTINILYDNAFMTSVTAPTSGSVVGYFSVPVSTFGSHIIGAQNTSNFSQTASTSFYVTPKITLDKIYGYVGDVIKISGSGYSASVAVTIYFDEVQVGSGSTTDSSGSFTDATFTVPQSTQGSHVVKVKDANGYSTTTPYTTYQRITISPASGTVNTLITVTGSGFLGNAAISITFDSIQVTTNPTLVTASSTGLFTATFNVPVTSSGPHIVQASDGSNQDNKTFTVSANATLSKTSGYVGDQVIVSGSGFLANSLVNVTFDGTQVGGANASPVGTVSISFSVPVRQQGAYTVIISDGTSSVQASFSISTTASIAPVTSTTSPGNVGMDITISGVGFLTGRAINVTYDGTQVGSGTVALDGSFTVTFKAPQSEHDSHTIVVTDGTNTRQFTFVMESTPPPVPSLILPATGTKTNSQPVFEWQTVTDPSGVTYHLEVATSSNFTPDSIVLQKTGLASPQYTVNSTEKLKSRSKSEPYSWRVQAIDGADNASQWSQPGSFYVGFIFELSQPVIYGLIALGAILLGLLGFWLGRRSSYYSD